MSNIIFTQWDKNTRCTVTHDRPENPVFRRKLSARRNTRDTSRVLRTWRECAHLLGHDYVAEKFRIGRVTLIIIVSLFLFLRMSDADAIDIVRRTLSNNVVDRRLVIKPIFLSLRRLSIRLGLGNHLPSPESTSFPRNYTMFAADAPMHRWVIVSSWMRKGLSRNFQAINQSELAINNMHVCLAKINLLHLL